MARIVQTRERRNGQERKEVKEGNKGMAPEGDCDLYHQCFTDPCEF